MIGVFLAWSLVQSIRVVDPAKYQELTAPTSIWGRHSWVNPRKLAAFVKAGDSRGSEAVRRRLNAYRNATRIARFGAIIYLVCALVLVAMMMR